jgi:hypothetical protein
MVSFMYWYLTPFYNDRALNVIHRLVLVDTLH